MSGERRPRASRTGVELAVQSGHIIQINGAAFSPDGSLLATAGADEIVKLWDVSLGRELRGFSGHSGPVYGVRFSDDGRLLASGSHDGTARVWDVATGRAVRVLGPMRGLVRGLAFSPDGRSLAVGLQSTRGPAVLVWNLRRGSVRARLPVRGPALAVAFSPDGKTLAVVDGRKNRLLVFETGSFHLLSEHRRAPAPARGGSRRPLSVGQLLFTADGRRVIAGGNGTVEVFDLSSRRAARRLTTPGYVFRFRLLPDGSLVTVRKDGLDRWDATLTRTTTWGAARGAIALSPDGRVAARLSNRCTVALVDAPSGRDLRLLRPALEVPPGVTNMLRYFSVAASPMFPVIAAGGLDGRVRVWDLRKLGTPRVLKPGGFIQALAFEPSGRYLAGSNQKAVFLWNLRDGTRVWRAEMRAPVVGLAFHPRGGLLAAFDQTGYLTILQTAAGRILQRTRGHRRMAFGPGDLTWSPDGRLLVTVANRRAVFWDPRRWRPRRSLPLGGAPVNAVAAGSRGKLAFGQGYIKWLVSRRRQGAANRVVLFPGRRRRPIRLRGHAGFVRALAFDLDGRVLASGSGDGALKLWDAQTGSELASFAAHAGDVTDVAFTSDGRFAVSTGLDGAVRLWDVVRRRLTATLLGVGAEDFVIALADHYYTASRGALRAVAFRRGTQAIPFDQFDLQLNRPDIVAARLGYALPGLIRAYRKAYRRRLRRMKLDRESARVTFELPRISLLGDRPPASTGTRRLELRVRTWSRSIPLHRLLVYVNDVPLRGAPTLMLKGRRRAVVDVAVTLAAGDNRIQVSALNKSGVESLRETFRVVYTGTAPKPQLYLLAIGVSKYADAALTLQFAAKDAGDLVSLLRDRAPSFEKVHVHLLQNGEATRISILAARRFLEKATIDDQVIVFFAGHGILLDGTYYFLPADFDRDRPKASALPYGELESLVEDLGARRKLVLLDTCHSGEADDEAVSAPLPAGVRRAGSFRGIRLKLKGKRTRRRTRRGTTAVVLGELFADLRRGSGSVVIAASGAAEYALEAAKWKNGVFTAAVLEALRSRRADRNQDGVLQVSELRRFVVGRVRQLTRGRQSPTARRENLAHDFAVQ